MREDIDKAAVQKVKIYHSRDHRDLYTHTLTKAINEIIVLREFNQNKGPDDFGQGASLN